MSVLVYGGTGHLGKCISNTFHKCGWYVISVSHHMNEACSLNITVPENISLSKQADFVTNELSMKFKKDKIDSIFCVAGGWVRDSPKSEDFLINIESMFDKNIGTALICTRLASLYLKEDGLLTFTGSNASLNPGPTCIGYNLSKMCIHSLPSMLVGSKKGVHGASTIVSILIDKLDTEINRQMMPNADYSKWVNGTDISKLLLDWTMDPTIRPPSGSNILVKKTEDPLEYVIL